MTLMTNCLACGVATVAWGPTKAKDDMARTQGASRGGVRLESLEP